MSRTTIIIIIGSILGLLAGIVLVGVLVLGPVLFASRTETRSETPGPVVAIETAAPTSTVTAEPTATNTAEPTATATVVSPSATAQTFPTTAPASSVIVSTTAVQYIQAQSDVNIRRGPGTGYEIIGFIAGGQTAKVTGVNTATGWWRVICPDDSIGSCWVTGRSVYTIPVSAATATPLATPIPAECTNQAALIADVTVPDNTQFPPTTGFIKTWRLKNTGSCTWGNSYQVVHAGGSLMGALLTSFPLNQTILPGQTVDISISLVSPGTADVYQSDWKLQDNQGRYFGLGSNGNPFYVRIIVAVPTPDSTITGKVYQDLNFNGAYDLGEPLMGSRAVKLIPGTACQVVGSPVATAFSGADGVYTFKGNFSGDYCVGLASGEGELEDVIGINLNAGQVLTNINLKALAPFGSISGYVWNDYCSWTAGSSEPVGHCVLDGQGGYRADGMIEQGESYISGVTVLIQVGSCVNNNNVAVSAVTDSIGRYTFATLTPGTYCVSINANAGSNQQILLPGIFTYPQLGIWYQEVVMTVPDLVFPVNFGWDYQLD